MMFRDFPHEPARMRRLFKAVASVAALAIPGLAAAANDPPMAAWPQLSGTYNPKTYSQVIRPVGGGDPPYTAEAMAAYKKNMVAAKAYTLDDKARHGCTPDGVPRILESPYPFEIVETPNRGEVWIIYELNHVARQVSIDKPMPPRDELETFPWYSGHSVGRFEGDTLVVETAGFNEKTYLDNSGAPHTDQLRTVERIRKINGGKELEDVVTIHDPGVFTRDWSARYVYQPRSDIRLMDYNCGEKHRDLSSVKGVRGH
jgi:hypothetical protein